MSREIKFRAWDNVDERMIFIGEDTDVSFSFDSCGITATKLQDYNDYDDSNFGSLEHLKYMQYTGLKDSKCVEIYEGDIIKNHNGRILKITFDVGSYFAEGYTKLGNEMCVPVNSCNESSEVIGNIYENPELLEEQS